MFGLINHLEQLERKHKVNTINYMNLYIFAAHKLIFFIGCFPVEPAPPLSFLWAARWVKCVSKEFGPLFHTQIIVSKPGTIWCGLWDNKQEKSVLQISFAES